MSKIDIQFICRETDMLIIQELQVRGADAPLIGMCINLRHEQIIAALIRAGWTPPEGQDLEGKPVGWAITAANLASEKEPKKQRPRRDDSLRIRLAESQSPDLQFANDHDNAILGTVKRCGQEPFVVYDYETVIQNFIADGMDREEEEEYVGFNWGAWVGATTPGILDPVPEK